MIIVSNTSPITNLSAIGQIELLQKIYKTIFIPQAVYNEISQETPSKKIGILTKLKQIKIQGPADFAENID